MKKIKDNNPLKETSDFYQLYSKYIPNCSYLKNAERKYRKFYGYFECKYYGEYSVRGDDLKHRGCKNCTRERVKSEYDKKWKEDCSIIHNNLFDYSDTIVGNVLTHSKIKCNKCNTIFNQTPASHKSGRGCPVCVLDIRGKSNKKDIDFVKNKSKNIGFNYDFSKSVYITCKHDIEIICDKGHTFYQSPDELLNAKHGCQVCSSAGISKQEKEVLQFVSNYFKCEQNNRKILKGKEIDIYIPSIGVGIEYNGIYWHSDEKIKMTHFDKLNLSIKEKTHLIFIYENDWIKRQNIVKNKLLDQLRIKKDKYIEVIFYDLDIKEETTEEIKRIYEENTLERYIKNKGYYSMRFNNEIIGIAAYKFLNGEKIIVDIIRPVNSTQTDYYINFIKYFKNYSGVVKVLAHLDWLDDLFLIKLQCHYVSLVEPIKFFISGSEIHKEGIKLNSRTITKAGFAVYRI